MRNKFVWSSNETQRLWVKKNTPWKCLKFYWKSWYCDITEKRNQPLGWGCLLFLQSNKMFRRSRLGAPSRRVTSSIMEPIPITGECWRQTWKRHSDASSCTYRSSSSSWNQWLLQTCQTELLWFVSAAVCVQVNLPLKLYGCTGGKAPYAGERQSDSPPSKWGTAFNYLLLFLCRHTKTNRSAGCHKKLNIVLMFL